MANTSPSALLAESLASLSKSAYQAFAEIENQARSEVARAVADAREARSERDNAVETWHKSQLEGQAWKQEVINYKASLKQTEISIAHQTETIAQLKREVNQWKDQSRNWQEHFLRVEQERCALSSRVDSLVSERLQWSRPFEPPAPLTPQHQSSNTIDSAPSSSTTKRASTSSFNIPLSSKSARLASPPRLDSPLTGIGAHKSIRSQLKPAKPSNPRAPLPDVSPPDTRSKPLQIPDAQTTRPQKVSSRTTTTEPRQTLIRRVQAVIHVKREEDEDFFNPGTKGEEPRKKRKIAPVDDDDYDEDGHQNVDENVTDEPDNDYSDEEDVTGDHSEDDDELMLGAEDNHHEVYGTQRVKTVKRNLHASGALPANRRRVTPARRRKI